MERGWKTARLTEIPVLVGGVPGRAYQPPPWSRDAQ
jgi:hypothetical protein